MSRYIKLIMIIIAITMILFIPFNCDFTFIIQKFLFKIKLHLNTGKKYVRHILYIIYLFYSLAFSLYIYNISTNHNGLILFKSNPSNVNIILMTLTTVTVLAINISFFPFLHKDEDYSNGVNITELLSLAYSFNAIEESKFFLVNLFIFIISSIVCCVHVFGIYLYAFSLWQITFIFILIIIVLNIITDFKLMAVSKILNDCVPDHTLKYRNKLNHMFLFYYYDLLKIDILHNRDTFSKYFGNKIDEISFDSTHYKHPSWVIADLLSMSFDSLKRLIYKKVLNSQYYNYKNYYKKIKSIIHYLFQYINRLDGSNSAGILFNDYMLIINKLYSVNPELFKNIFVINNNYKYLIPVEICKLERTYSGWVENNHEIINEINGKTSLTNKNFKFKKTVLKYYFHLNKTKLFKRYIKSELIFLKTIKNTTYYKITSRWNPRIYKDKDRKKMFVQMEGMDKSLFSKLKKKYGVYN